MTPGTMKMCLRTVIETCDLEIISKTCLCEARLQQKGPLIAHYAQLECLACSTAREDTNAKPITAKSDINQMTPARGGSRGKARSPQTSPFATTTKKRPRLLSVIV